MIKNTFYSMKLTLIWCMAVRIFWGLWKYVHPKNEENNSWHNQKAVANQRICFTLVNLFFKSCLWLFQSKCGWMSVKKAVCLKHLWAGLRSSKFSKTSIGVGQFWVFTFLSESGYKGLLCIRCLTLPDTCFICLYVVVLLWLRAYSRLLHAVW